MSQLQWIPNSQTPLTIQGSNGQQLMNPVWYRFFWTLAEIKLGGVNSPSVTSVAADTAAVTVQSQANAQSLKDTVTVLQDNAIPGAGDIPPPVGNDGNPIP